MSQATAQNLDLNMKGIPLNEVELADGSITHASATALCRLVIGGIIRDVTVFVLPNLQYTDPSTITIGCTWLHMTNPCISWETGAFTHTVSDGRKLIVHPRRAPPSKHATIKIMSARAPAKTHS